MKYVLILLLTVFMTCPSVAQPPKPNNPEMQQMINEMKKEIAQLEEDIKRAEKEDPDEVASLKEQLAAYKKMLAQLGGSMSPAKGSGATTPAKAALVQTPNPIMPVILKQPVAPPAAGQDKDRYFWYRGKKINDSTLITSKRMLVQYSKKRDMLIVEPDKKADSFFVRMGAEIAKGEQRKAELVSSFNRAKNGFMEYPNVAAAVDLYDDMTERYSKAVANTFKFDEKLPEISRQAPARKGPAEQDEQDDWIAEMLKRIEQAKKDVQSLPPVEQFPMPPRSEYGLCTTCDSTYIKRMKKATDLWMEAFLGKEQKIASSVLGAERVFQLLGAAQDGDQSSPGWDIVLGLMDRIRKKADILVSRVGDDIHYTQAVAPIVLGIERQRQLLGAGEGQFGSMDYVVKMLNMSDKFLKEQKELKNFDVALDYVFKIGIERQKQLLGCEDCSTLGDLMREIEEFNRFALTMEIDFVVETGDPGDFDSKYTGRLEMKERIVGLKRDGCKFRLFSWDQDLNNTTFNDVGLEFEVKGGQYTYTEDGKKKTVAYSGPPGWIIPFPDTKVHFCMDGVKDSAILSGFTLTEADAASLQPDGPGVYKSGMGSVGSLVWRTMDRPDGESQFTAKGLGAMSDAVGAMTSKDPGNDLERMKMQYESKNKLLNSVNATVAAAGTQKSVLEFLTNNRSTVLIDTYSDAKRDADPYRIVRGMTHIRLVHKPLTK